MASLVKKIDQVIQQNPDRLKSRSNFRVASYAYFLGDDFERLKIAATEFGKKHKIKHVPLMVDNGSRYGPRRLNLHADAEVTVIIYGMKSGILKIA